MRASEFISASTEAWEDGRYGLAVARARSALKCSQTDLDRFKSLNNLVESLRKMARVDEAERLARQALSLTQASRCPETRSFEPTGLKLLACCLQDQDHRTEALFYREAGVELERELFGSPGPTSLISLGSLLTDLHRFSEALAIFDACDRLEMTEEQAATLLGNRAVVLGELGREEECEALHREDLRRAEDWLGSDHVELITPLENVAVVLIDRGRYRQALHYVLRARRLCERWLGRDHPRMARTLELQACCTEGDRTELYRRGLAVADTRLRRADILAAWGCWLSNIDRDYEALELLEEALSLRQRFLGACHPETLQIRLYRANIFRCLERFESAALELDAILGAVPPFEVKVHHERSRLAWVQGDRTQAIELLHLAIAALGDYPDHPYLVELRRDLGKAEAW